METELETETETETETEMVTYRAHTAYIDCTIRASYIALVA